MFSRWVALETCSINFKGITFETRCRVSLIDIRWARKSHCLPLAFGMRGTQLSGTTLTFLLCATFTLAKQDGWSEWIENDYPCGKHSIVDCTALSEMQLLAV